MNKRRNILTLYWLSYGVVLIILHCHVRLFGDDWVYYSTAHFGFSDFYDHMIKHYTMRNGRFIVHLLASLFSSWPLWFWRIFNIAMLLTVIFVVNKISNSEFKRSKDVFCAASFIIPFFLISSLDILMTNQSIYWLMGSFNYLYPIMLVVILIHLYTKDFGKKPNWVVLLVGFLAGASVEQAGLMALGFVVFSISYKYLHKKYLCRRDMLLLLVVLIGLLSVLLAPAQFERFQNAREGTNGVKDLLIRNISLQGAHFLFSKTMVWVHLINIYGIFCVLVPRLKQVKIRFLEKVIISVALIGITGFLAQMALGIYDLEVGFDSLTVELVIFCSIMAIGYGVGLFHTAVIFYLKGEYENKYFPLLLLLLGFGSMSIMLISPVYGMRTLIFPIIMLALSGIIVSKSKTNLFAVLAMVTLYYFIVDKTAYSLICLLLCVCTYINGKYSGLGPRVFAYSEQVIHAALFIMVLVNFGPTIDGYRENARVYDENIQLAAKFNSEAPKIKQYKMKNSVYHWAMPYESDFYISYYLRYLGLNEQLEIEWVECPSCIKPPSPGDKR